MLILWVVLRRRDGSVVDVKQCGAFDRVCVHSKLVLCDISIKTTKVSSLSTYTHLPKGAVMRQSMASDQWSTRRHTGVPQSAGRALRERGRGRGHFRGAAGICTPRAKLTAGGAAISDGVDTNRESM